MRVEESVHAYEHSTEYFLKEALLVNAQNIDRHVESGWSARQVIHHIADSEAQSYARLRRLIAEPVGSVIQGYDEAAWAQCVQLGYQELPTEHSLAVFRAVRAASLDVLRRLSEQDLERYGEHSESGRYTLATWLDVYTEHPRAHAAQLVEAVNA
ncbi:MAG TPA: DinB family protein [Acidimicrobiales bacterium]